MPTYEYKCPAGHRFEKFYATMNDSRRVKCPTCGKQAERQISGGTGLAFKGSGLYLTAYKRPGAEQKTEGAKGAAKPTADTKAQARAPPSDRAENQTDARANRHPTP